MKDLNLNVQFTDNGSAFIKVYCANYVNKKGNIERGLKYANKEMLIREKEMYKDLLEYTFLNTDTEIIFL